MYSECIFMCEYFNSIQSPIKLEPRLSDKFERLMQFARAEPKYEAPSLPILLLIRKSVKFQRLVQFAKADPKTDTAIVSILQLRLIWRAQ